MNLHSLGNNTLQGEFRHPFPIFTHVPVFGGQYHLKLIRASPTQSCLASA